MVGSAQLMDSLRGIGLNLYERKLWVSLLAKGVATAGELSSIAHVPRSRTYDVLQTLADKGFAIVQTSKPLKYVAVPPSEALEKAKQRLKEDLETKAERIERLKGSKLLDELDSIHKQGMEMVSPEDMTGSLKGRYSAIQQLDFMFKGAENSVNIITTASGLNELFENHLSVIKGLKQRGVKIRIATKINDGCADAVKALSSLADIRKISEKDLPIHGKFAVVDGQQMIFGLSDPDDMQSQHMMFWTKSQHASKNLANPLFDLVWEKSASVNSNKK
ncbi:MAG: TrmB family transcriptional regulator [Candidatus Aenigmarchaeota archaeon]|nr:TrmB family transcriptional regulator [Candidatus Aenigmarchaeota archaeon]